MNTESELFPMFLTLIITGIIAVPSIILYRRYLINNRIKRENAILELDNSIKNAFILGNINNLKDLIGLIEGFPKFRILRPKFPDDIATIFFKLKYNLSISSTIHSDNIQKMENIKDEVEKFIEEEKIKAPFENAPPIEKNLLIDILELSGQKSNNVFRDKLNRLSEQIITRQSTIEKLSSDNAESLKRTKLSLTLAILFFIISTAITIYSLINK